MAPLTPETAPTQAEALNRWSERVRAATAPVAPPVELERPATKAPPAGLVWVEVGLPWLTSESEEDIGPAPYEETGAEQRAWAAADPRIDGDFTLTLFNACRALHRRNAYKVAGMDVDCLNPEDPAYPDPDKLPEQARLELGGLRDDAERFDTWIHTLPAFKAWEAKREAAFAAWKAKSFRYQARPGMFIVLADGTGLLIGDINTQGGVCDDCSGLDSGDIVARYAILPEFELLRAMLPQR